MKTNTKSSITLPAPELKLVIGLMKTLSAKTKVEVIRRGLMLLKEQTDSKQLKESYTKASLALRESHKEEMAELDGLINEGLK